MADRLKIRYVPTADLRPYARNARTHSEAQIAQLAASIEAFGWTNPVLVDEQGGLIAGHGRVQAALALGIDQVPTVTLAGLSGAQKAALVIADNKLALNAGWDVGMLAQELQALDTGEMPLGLTGFSEDELESLLTWAPGFANGLTDPDEVPPVAAQPVTAPGDLWILGRHRLLCGDATKAKDVARLLAGVIPDLANCDAPYGISVVKGSHIGGAKPFGDRSRLGRVHGPARRAIILPGMYEPVIGDDSTETGLLSYAVVVSIGVPAIVLWGGNYFASELPPSRCWLVWDKENTGTFADAELAWTNQDKPARLLRHQWSGLIKASERGERRVHPTQKPVALAEWVIDVIAPHAKAVLDLFLGSGSTLIACERKGVACFGAELSPAYVDVTVERWQNFTGKTATLESTGEPFQKVKHESKGPRSEAAAVASEAS